MKPKFNTLKPLLLLSASGAVAVGSAEAQEQPNVIVILADDLGWGDVGYNGNSVVQTPRLDAMAQDGATLTNFYTAAPLSSPTRGSILTGRHPFRFGVLAAHTGALRSGEITLAEVCRDNQYATGFFGKWHLGWIELAGDSARGYYSPPEYHGFDEVFATRSAVPTWNPTVTPDNFNMWGNVAGGPWKGSRYLHNGEPVTENLDGDDSRVIMDRVIPFIDESIASEKPFMACVWFHTPHEPVVAGPEYLKMYEGLEDEEQRHYFGAITAMDDQIGRLLDHLEEMGVADNTIICFTSDNGPSGGVTDRGVASAGDFKGHKHQVYEGGLRVPSIITWPSQIAEGQVVGGQTSTCDYLPTIIELAGLKFKHPSNYFVDGLSQAPALLRGETVEREQGIFAGWMRLAEGTYGRALIDGDYKLVYPEKSQVAELYNIACDPNETNNIIEEHPEIVESMIEKMTAHEKSFDYSLKGGDYKTF
ncbi:MAG: sulfatase-like hydrolase/transferase [Rikenellaceae bacterium]